MLAAWQRQRSVMGGDVLAPWQRYLKRDGSETPSSGSLPQCADLGSHVLRWSWVERPLAATEFVACLPLGEGAGGGAQTAGVAYGGHRMRLGASTLIDGDASPSDHYFSFRTLPPL